RRQRCAQCLARLLAAAALGSADRAMSMVGGVELAFVGAGTARRQTRLEDVQLRWRMGLRLATEDAHGGGACVRAVEAEADAADEFADVGLADARVRADGAGRLAGAALVQTSRK